MNRYLTTRKVRAGLVAGALGVALVAGTTTALPASAAPEPIKHVVVLEPGTDPNRVASSVGVTPEQVYTEVIDGFSALLTPEQVTRLRAVSTVTAVRPDRIVQSPRSSPPDAGRLNGEPTPGGEGRALEQPRPVANQPLPQPSANTQRPAGEQPLKQASRRPDPRGPRYEVPQQPAQIISAALRRVGVLESVTARVNGRGRDLDVDIAVFDSGIDPYHPDLRVAGGIDCVERPRSADYGWYDREGHGTLVAGFAAARDNAIGYVGVAPGARLWAVRVVALDGSISESSLLCGLEWLHRNRRSIEVANLSLEGDGTEPTPGLDTCGREPRPGRAKRYRVVDPIHSAICDVTRAGVTVVVAAGNASADVDQPPRIFAAYPEVISVSAIADYDGLPGGLAPVPPGCLVGLPDEFSTGFPDDELAAFSNFGRSVDIAAPGVCVSSTFPGGLYAGIDGTSFSAPLVAGAAALLAVRHPRWSPERVRKELLRRATPGPIPGDPDNRPEGVLNVQGF